MALASVSKEDMILVRVLIVFFLVVIRPAIMIGIAIWRFFLKPALYSFCFLVIVAGNLIVIVIGKAIISLGRKLFIFKPGIKGGAF